MSSTKGRTCRRSPRPLPRAASARSPVTATLAFIATDTPREFTVRRIGTVRSPATEKVDENWGSVESLIELEPEYRAGLRGLEAFSHALVVALLHGAAFEPARHLVRRPRGQADMPELGIFA